MHKEEGSNEKIGMLTSGGDCQALNAADERRGKGAGTQYRRA